MEPSDKYPVVVFNDHSGPETVPAHDLEVARPPLGGPGNQLPGTDSYYVAGGWQQYHHHDQHRDAHYNKQYQPASASGYTGSPASTAHPHDVKIKDRKRILGLPARFFWILVVVLVVILAAGIGGGVAGGLAASSSNKDDNNNRQRTDEPSATGSSSSSSSSSSSATPTASRLPGSILPPATDDCPTVNNSIVSPLNATGQPWASSREDNSPQRFQIHCDRDMSADIRKGTIDIMRVAVRTLDECVAACAGYNFQFNNNAVYGAGRSSAGLCRAVTLSKKSGDYCFLKNGSMFDFQSPQPWLVSSAVLVE